MDADKVLYDMLDTPIVTRLLSKVKVMEDGSYVYKPALFPEMQIDYDVESCINFYPVSPIYSGMSYYSYSVNCRSNTESKARTIAKAVEDAINRQLGESAIIYGDDDVFGIGKVVFGYVVKNGVFCRTERLQIIREDENSWNLPVSVKVFTHDYLT